MYGSLTGDGASFGQSSVEGAQLAVEEINNAGGVLGGRKIRLLVEDDQSRPEEASSAVTKLITQDKVVAVLGEVASRRTLAAAPVAQKYQIPLITPASTNERVTQVGDYIFRVCFIDPFQGEVLAKFAYNDLKARTVAVLKDIQQDYSVGLTDSIQKTFTGLGGKVLDPVSYSSGDADFRAILTQVRAQKPDAIFATGYYPEAAIIVRQARELGMTMPILGGDGWVGDALKNGREALKNTFISNHYSGDNPDPDRAELPEGLSREVQSRARFDRGARLRCRQGAGRLDQSRGNDRRSEGARCHRRRRRHGRDRSAQDERRPQRQQAGRHRGDPVRQRGREVCLQDHDQPELVDTFLQQFINGLSLGAIYALIALGYTMVYGVLRLINFAHGDVYMLGAFAGYYLANSLNLDANPSILGAIVVTMGAMAICAGIGIVIERFAYRPVRHHSRLTSLITAIGVSLLLEYGGQVVFGATPRFFPQMISSQTYSLGGVQITNQALMIIVVAVIMMFGLEFIVHRTKIGKAMRAVSFNLPVARLMGINTDFVIAFTFALGSALAAVAGVLVALSIPRIDPLMGLMTGLKAFVAAVLGGIGSIPGAMLGGMLIGLMETWISATAYSTYRDAVAFAVLILILLFRPAGILGTSVTEKV